MKANPPMPPSRSKSTSPVHFAPGPSGTLRWMGYWAFSRAHNALRHLGARWRGELRPALHVRQAELAGRVRDVVGRTDGSVAAPHPSLAAAVREVRQSNGSEVSVSA